MSRLCLATGKWSGVVPTCVRAGKYAIDSIWLVHFAVFYMEHIHIYIERDRCI